MPTVSDNLKLWNQQYEWPDGGEEWSAQFGGTEALWWFVVYPRIHRFLPASSILEIAPGGGRWTQFLIQQSRSFIAVDISEKCVERCKTRFAREAQASFHVNDGCSLAAVPDNSIDFVFSFDSLVHVEKDVIEGYLVQLALKLKPDGVGFFHHSNLGSYRGRLSLLRAYRRLPSVFRAQILKEKYMEGLLSINAQGWRSTSMTAELFQQYCKKAGFHCVGQELINWNKGKCLIDALSFFARPDSRWTKETVYVENGDFVRSSMMTARLAGLYCR